MTEKALGYSLISVGLILVFVALFNVYGVFTGIYKPVQVFKFSSVGLDTSSFLPKEVLQQGFAPSQQKAELLPASILNDTSNLFAHMMFMGFVASSGYKVASIGTYLVRTIKVGVKEEKAKV